MRHDIHGAHPPTSREFKDFSQANAQVDLLTFDFLDEAAVAALDWSGNPDRHEMRAKLMTHQRLLRLHPDSRVASGLHARGFTSAQHIAAVPEGVFVAQAGDLFGAPERARQAHAKARTVRGQVAHLWANVHGVAAASRTRAIRSLPLPERLAQQFQEMPNYEDLFGPLDYCDCQHCQSIFGPAAYFVDLMRIIQRYVTEPNATTIPAPLLLSDRRPGLFDLELTCANTNDLVPYIRIVNEVLAARAASELNTDDVFLSIASATYPFNLPLNIHLDQVRGYLGLLGTSLASVYAAFLTPFPADAPPAPAIASARLNLSPERWALVTTPVTDPDGQKTLYGLTGGDLASLSLEAVFLLQTGLTRDALASLLYGNLGPQEIAAGLNHGFLINQPLPAGAAVSFHTDTDGTRKITNLTDATRDRINRFVRLSQWSGIGFSDLDLLLAALGRRDLDADALVALAQACDVLSAYKLPVPSVAAFWSDMQTVGVGSGPAPADLFDQIYNAPAVLQGKAPYHPIYPANPLYTTPVESWKIDDTERPASGFGRARLMAALSISDDQLTALGTLLFGAGATVPLDVPNLSLLYRTVLILRALNLSLADYRTLLGLLHLDPATAFAPAALLKLRATCERMAQQRLSVAELAYMVLGTPAKGLTPAPLAYVDMRSLWMLAQPGLLQPTAFIADQITEDRSRDAFALLLAQTDPPLISSVSAAYGEVFEKAAVGDVAIVLRAATSASLDFLKAAGCSAADIAIIRDVLQRSWDAQYSLLTTQFAAQLGSTADVLDGVVAYFDAAKLPVAATIQALLTPVPECTGAGRNPDGSCQTPNPDFAKLASAYALIGRMAATAGRLDLDGAFLGALAAMPKVFALSDLRAPSLDCIMAILDFQALGAAFEAPQADLLAYFALPSDTKCATGTKSAALADLSGWQQAQICQVAANIGRPTALYDTAAGVARLAGVFALLARTGMDAFFAQDLLALRDLKADAASWPTYARTAQAVTSIAGAKLGDSFAEAAKALDGHLQETMRDALEGLVLWRMRQRFPTFTSSRQLYELLLIDVEMSACSEVSYIAEGLNALQLYLQRTRLGLEDGINTLPIPHIWWEWMMNYRVWEANRKIFLYPENYLVPSIRTSRTGPFRSMQSALEQSGVSTDLVETNFLQYLEAFDQLTTLTYVDALEGIVDDGERGPVETSFLFARTREEPYIYYYNTKQKDAAWGEWLKIDLAIPSRFITPVYAFSRLFIFWVELTPTQSSQITTEDGKGTRSENRAVYRAIIRYSFYSVSKSWSAPQSLGAEEVVYVDPAATPFDDASGYRLFSMNSLYWHKVNALRFTGENLTGQPKGTAAGEKIVILYGPFIDNNVTGTPLRQVDPPAPALATQNAAKYAFDLNVYQRTVEVNQAVAGRVRGSISMTDARVLNADLNSDFVMRSTEFLLLVTNAAAGIPPVVAPKLDVALATLNIEPSRDALRSNYYGDYTSNISYAVQPQKVGAADFLSPGITDTQSRSIFNDMVFNGVIPADGTVPAGFSLNTNLSFLFAGASAADKAILIPSVQEILFVLRARRTPATAASFILPAIDAGQSATVLKGLQANGVVGNDGFVNDTFSSTTSLNFLFSGAPADTKALLIGQVRRVLFRRLGDPKLLASTARDIARTIMVKNQPGEFIFNNGDEAFRVTPETVRLPLISARTRISDISTDPKVFDYSFVVENIDLATSRAAFTQLKANGVVGGDGTLSPDFGPLTDMGFLFPGTPEPKRTLQAAQVRAALLNLPSITALRYYYEREDLILQPDAFVAPGIDSAASAETLNQLKAEGVVDDGGVISPRFSTSTDLSFLFPDKDPGTRDELTEEVRAILRNYYAATWQRSIHDLKFRFTRLTTGATSRLSARLFSGGIDRLLALGSQQIPVVPILPFTRYEPTRRVIAPAQFDGAQVDFDGPYGLYYWELFFFTPQFVATSLLAQRRFDEALGWFQYIFDPTSREAPLSPVDFITPDISEQDAVLAYAELRENGIVAPDGQIAPGFGNDTYLGFLWPDTPDSERKTLMVREARNVLLNHQLSKPAARFWQFRPFRNHTLESLQATLSDEAQIYLYNNNPFDPYAIARLRIGAFEKATLMGYLDTLIAWGDAMYAQYTWEGLTSAMMLYDYAYNLLGDRPVDLGPCPSQPPATFRQILDKYQSQPGGVPQFLIYLENILPPGEVVAPDMDSTSLTDSAPYFCVPENDKLLGYWDQIEDRLFKLRHCLDLDGKPLKLPLFAPPIDPLALVRAAAAGQSSAAVVAQSLPVIPPYKFATLLNHARTLTGTVQALGDALQNALSSRDSEALARLQNTFELTLQNQTTREKELQVEAAQAALERLQASQAVFQIDADFYTKQLAEGLLSGEKAQIGLAITATILNSTSAILETASAMAHLQPDVGSPFAMKWGGTQVGTNLSKAAATFGVLGKIAEVSASVCETTSGFTRREQDWTLQRDHANGELAGIKKEINGARIALEIAKRELDIHRTTVSQTAEIQDFLKSKFSSTELYSWMSGRISTLYFQAYKLALDAALAAQSAYGYELNLPGSFVNFDYWDSLHHGLLAGQGLDSAINQMERAYLANNTRRLEIRRTVSLARLAPAELHRLQTTGECTITLGEALYDLDFPGHYCRQIRSFQIMLMGSDGEPIANANIELTQTSNSLVLAPSEDAVAYLLGQGGDDAPLSVRQNWQSRQQIALSNSQNPWGTVDDSVNFSDERYLPFEGTGAVSTWRCSVPQKTNGFPIGEIADVVLTVAYTARNGGDAFRQNVEQLIARESFRCGALLDLAKAYPAAWEAFMKPAEGAKTQEVSFPIQAGDFPRNQSGLKLAGIDLQLIVPGSLTLPAEADFIKLTVAAETAVPVVLHGLIGTAALTDLPARQFEGNWALTFDLAKLKTYPEARALLGEDGCLDADVLKSIRLVLTYTASLFSTP
ncbi:neuraminidase-like domain-containing protein [Xanthobacteraceae bacterium A53D]